MFGYATNETDNYMPSPIALAHKLAKRLEIVRKDGTLDSLLPDGKTQVTVEYNDSHIPTRIDTIVISNQHKAWVNIQELQAGIKKQVIESEVWDLIDEDTIIHINPTGKFTIGWPKGDAGLTGRKIIIDSYGWVGRHGGGAFSGKDSTKVDRSWAYMARYLAKNIVASWVCQRCELQLSYAIWVAQPVSIYVNTFETHSVDPIGIMQTIKDNFDLTPNGIITKLDLKKPIYQKTATYGHFGRDDVSWEKLDSVEIFQQLLESS